MENTDERFRTIYDRYMPLLRVIAGRKSIPYDEIDDMVQETFTLYYEHYPVTWPEYQIRAMLAKIMRNLCADYYRRSRTHPITYMDPSLPASEEILSRMLQTGTAGKDPLDIVLKCQQTRQILEVLRTMKNDWLIVFVLYIIQERPMKEISKMLNLSEAACRMRLMRGRSYLRDQLKKTEQEPQQTASAPLSGNAPPSPRGKTG